MSGVADTVVLVPILRRAHHVRPLIASVRATSRAAVLFLCTPGDQGVIEEIINVGAEMMFVDWQPVGDYARKIGRGYASTTHPYLFTGADDLRFHRGWLTAAKAAMTPGIGVVGTNDLGNPRVIAGEHSTHSLISRAYIDEQGGTADGGPGTVLCENYLHEYVDDELVGVAKKRGAFATAPNSIVEHLHPNWAKEVPAPGGEPDQSYAGQQRRMRTDRNLYLRRRQLWA